ncbi:protein-glutamate O-methyltransferase CheR [Natrialba sp. INN-245]|uniref:CheR family methyltransferase n=1 Tax=Natrialba sp. INN-245 TaxID=2690967 RepID=UPI0013133C16|nr:chemotaxis protein CheR [Natrialba sp. INN-245]
MSSDDSFELLLEYMETELSFATSHYNDSYLDRRITARMRRTECETYEEYYEHVRSNPDEQRALLDSLSINVTGFFRNPEVWDGVRDVLRSLAGETDRIDIWSAACADGREPYSLSMIVHDEPQVDPSTVRILGTDISNEALEVAREGVYQESRTTSIGGELEYIDEYSQFIEYDSGENAYRVRDTIKQPVEFQRHDLINGDPKSGFDLVTCRNLFIYIDTEYKQSMLQTISESISQGGYLIIGKSETIPPEMKPVFSPVDNRNRIYQKQD